MKLELRLAQEALNLNHSYLEGGIELANFASRLELLVENLESSLSPDEYGQAMDCAYYIEEVNALTLDEGRVPSKTERDGIERELIRLDSLLSRIRQ